jgi:hypothetical protein
VNLNGGDSAGSFAQIGNGGRQTSGSESGDITVHAGGDVTLTGGGGDEAYVQIGHGGAESNAQSQGYTLAGLVTVTGENVTLAAGDGDGAYAQVGHGGFGRQRPNLAIRDQRRHYCHRKSGTSPHRQRQRRLWPDWPRRRPDEHQRRGEAHGAISGDIVVTAPNRADGSIDMTVGDDNALCPGRQWRLPINAPTEAIARELHHGAATSRSAILLSPVVG